MIVSRIDAKTNSARLTLHFDEAETSREAIMAGSTLGQVPDPWDYDETAVLASSIQQSLRYIRTERGSPCGTGPLSSRELAFLHSALVSFHGSTKERIDSLPLHAIEPRYNADRSGRRAGELAVQLATELPNICSADILPEEIPTRIFNS